MSGKSSFTLTMIKYSVSFLYEGKVSRLKQMKPCMCYCGYSRPAVHAGIDAELCFEGRANRGSTSISYLLAEFIEVLFRFLRL